MNNGVKTIGDLIREWRHVTPWFKLWPLEVRERAGVQAIGIAPSTSKDEKAVENVQEDREARGLKTLSGDNDRLK